MDRKDFTPILKAINPLQAALVDKYSLRQIG